MVLQKRLDFGFNGYQLPYMPRATRSARRSSFKKRGEDNQMCAFDLLATVAGKLLLDKQTPPISSNGSTDENQSAVVKDSQKKEMQDENKQWKVETPNQGSWDRGFCVSELVSPAQDQKYSRKESPCNQEDAPLRLASVITTSDCSEGFVDQKLVNGKAKNEMGILASKVEVGPSGYREYGDCKIEVETKESIKDELHKTGKVQFGTKVGDGKSPALVSSDSSVKLPLCRDDSPHNSFPVSQDYVNVVSRDDDENSSGCTHPNTTKKSSRPAPCIGDRRIRKILASKNWKVGPKLKDVTLSSTDGELRSVYRSRNSCYKSIRSERNYPIKKRRLFNYSSESNYDGGISGEGICVSPKRVMNEDVSGLCSKMHEVKLRIKSFRVPELFIEMPETASVGSLKRRVMEAVNAIFGGGLRVGVLLQGKKVRDDSKTLLQTEVSHYNQLDALGFSLEPNTSQTPPILCSGDSPFMLSCDKPQPLSRYTSSPSIIHQGNCDVAPEQHVTNIGNFVESDHDSAPSPTDMSIDKSTKDSKALVTVPAVSVEALAVVPVHRKSKRSEIVQRRIRRPFSVAEVEALVQAVEKLGTGRWRDVKLRAFDSAKHRTYVDLKDKWKTLVHTARISPQQRRGEPVPQELLDRVLTAHAYWSQQQAKQQLKPQPETCLLL
ncbi:telomere repeat-binding protein 5-like isoform X2 [Mangifera indica]|uniref:telomere repeat-binding protein 5-like isoform X2 n=1 Tax=Mangifera indica TaxID=29780 RepID=UPI001CFAAF35|nr:telomere repeat-binding protein 5-like isoform X2 [Mangifera indica]